MNAMKTITISMRGPYRYVDCGYTEAGTPDFRLQKKDFYTKRYSDIYLFDNQMQMLTAIEDYDYTLWLDGQPCYQRDTIRSPYL